MSITSTAIGKHTTQITIAGGSTHNEVISALDIAIVAGGWQQHDVINPRNRVYKCLNKDGQTFKYIKVTFDIGGFKIYTTSFESWNAVTHVGTNEVFTGHNTGVMGYAFDLCDIIIMASNRWCLLQTFIRNQPSPWSGVIEIARDATENTVEAGFPCWIWLSSVNALTSGAKSFYASLPRTRSGLTGEAAVIDGWQTPYARISSGASDGRILTKYVTYAWDTTKKIVHAARPTIGDTEMHGRMFGMKMTYNIGSSFNRIGLPVDDDYFYSSAGEETEHWVLAANPVSAPSAWLTPSENQSGSYALSSVSSPNTRWVEPVGTYFYCATATNITKIDSSGTTLGAFSVITGSSGTYTHLKYDGNRYLYCASATGVTRVDTWFDDAVSFLPITDGSFSLWFDGKWLWSIPTTTKVNNLVTKINVSTFTVEKEITITLNTRLTDMCSDYDDNIYVAALSGYIIKIDKNDQIIFTKRLFTSPGTSTHAMVSFDNDTLVSNHIISTYGNVFYTDRDAVIIKQVNDAAPTLKGPDATVLKYNTFKLGRYIVTNCPHTTGAINTDGNMNISDKNITNLNSTYHQFPYKSIVHANSDSNRMWFIDSGVFYYMTNVFHGDSLSVGYGRFLLPK